MPAQQAIVVEQQLDALADTYGDDVHTARGPLHDLFERIFNHQDFTGRSGTMFGFEGLGSVYWHMVSKLLLAIQENFFAARENNADLIVMGNSVNKALLKRLLADTVLDTIKSADRPLFLSQ